MSERRRGRGEGSISRRADGRWMGRVDLGWQDGRRRSKAIYGRTRRAVADALRDAQKSAREGTLVVDERQTVEQFLTRWLQDVAQSRVRPRTYVSYEGAISLHIVPHLGKRRLSQLTPQHVQAWLSALEHDDVTVPCRRYARVVLRNALNTALRWRLIPRNAATLVDAPRANGKEIQPLTPAQAKQLMSAARGQELEAFIGLALGCGLRRGEVLGLKWADVDLDAATIQIRGAIQRFGGDPTARRRLRTERKQLKEALFRAVDGQVPVEDRTELEQQLARNRAAQRAIKTSLQLVEPKSNRSRRTIAIPSVAVTALRAHRVRQLEARLAKGSAWKDQGFVFTSGIGTPVEPRKVTREFKALLKDADLPAIRLHDLRHYLPSLTMSRPAMPSPFSQHAFAAAAT